MIGNENTGTYKQMHQYELEKWIWTEADFERMGWHDSKIYALAFSPETFELLLDIDYIFEWVQPEPGKKFFKFWIDPATLVFQNVYDVDFDIQAMGPELEILSIVREQSRAPETQLILIKTLNGCGRLTVCKVRLNCGQSAIRSIFALSPGPTRDRSSGFPFAAAIRSPNRLTTWSDITHVQRLLRVLWTTGYAAARRWGLDSVAGSERAKKAGTAATGVQVQRIQILLMTTFSQNSEYEQLTTDVATFAPGGKAPFHDEAWLEEKFRVFLAGRGITVPEQARE